MSWKQKLKQLGYDESNMPNMIAKAIRDLKVFESRVQEIDETIENGEISDIRKKELEEERDTIIESIEAQEDVINSKIDQWERNKETYKAKAELMKQARKGKTKDKQENKVEQETKQPAPAPQPPQPPKEDVIELEAEEIKPTKSKGISKVAVFILLGVLTFGAYNYLKNND